MKRFFICFILLPSLILLPFSVFRVSAAGVSPLSPGLAVLASRTSLIKNAVRGEEIRFTASDFETALGVERAAAVTVVSLPLVTEGKLMLGDAAVSRGQLISRTAMNSLRFVPTDLACTGSSFSFFCGANAYETECVLYYMEAENGSPSVSVGEEKRTYADVTCFGRLTATDPEGDPVRFEITSYPEHGILIPSEDGDGTYSYTPVIDYTGSDRFVCTAVDRFGNRSEPAEVTVLVEKKASGTVMSDMIGKYGHNEAIRAVEAGLMSAKSELGRTSFEPDLPVTRLEFLVSAMNAAGYRIATTVSGTGYRDDASIDPALKGYVAAAKKMGFIEGEPDAGAFYFEPDRDITSAEAYVITGRILSLPVRTGITVSDPSVPVWAAGAFEALSGAGLIDPGFRYNDPSGGKLTRAGSAVLLDGIMNLRER